jgi:L-threonylcarbamoyladenylate synthase
MDAVARVIAALQAGEPVLLPTDTVYGLCAAPDEEASARAYALKGRNAAQPTALIAATSTALTAAVPELDERILTALLPGPYTLVLPNPVRRYPWLTGARPDTIGVRVPALPPEAKRILDEVGCVLGTSANEPGDPAPARLDQIPLRIREACGAELDAGELPGVASTVLDLTGDNPHVIREGAASAAEALARIAVALGG